MITTTAPNFREIVAAVAEDRRVGLFLKMRLRKAVRNWDKKADDGDSDVTVGQMVEEEVWFRSVENGKITAVQAANPAAIGWTPDEWKKFFLEVLLPFIEALLKLILPLFLL